MKAQHEDVKNRMKHLLEKDGTAMIPITVCDPKAIKQQHGNHAMEAVIKRNADGEIDFYLQNTWKGQSEIRGRVRGKNDEERLNNIMHIVSGRGTYDLVGANNYKRQGSDGKPRHDTATWAKQMTFGGQGKMVGVCERAKRLDEILEDVHDNDTPLNWGQQKGNCHISGISLAMNTMARLSEEKNGKGIDGLTVDTLNKDILKLDLADETKAGRVLAGALSKNAKSATTLRAMRARMEHAGMQDPVKLQRHMSLMMKKMATAPQNGHAAPNQMASMSIISASLKTAAQNIRNGGNSLSARDAAFATMRQTCDIPPNENKNYRNHPLLNNVLKDESLSADKRKEHEFYIQMSVQDHLARLIVNCEKNPDEMEKLAKICDDMVSNNAGAHKLPASKSNNGQNSKQNKRPAAYLKEFMNITFKCQNTLFYIFDDVH